MTCNNYRPPSLLAKMASTVDVLSHGRLDFGIGAGWYEEEYRAYGYPFPDGPERLRMLDEALQVIRAMWTEPYATFEGKHYQVQGAINEPKGVQQPHIPIWVGGSGEKVTLKLAAKYGDACNVVGLDTEVARHKFDVLRQHCENVGTDYDKIVKSVHSFIVLLEPGEDVDQATKYRGDMDLETVLKNNIVGTSQQVAERLNELVEAGAEYFIIYLRNRLAQMDTLRMFAEEVIPLVRS